MENLDPNNLEPQTAPDEIRFEESAWSWPEATAGQRAVAFVLDTLILTAVFAFLEALGSRVLPDGYPKSLNTLILLIYFCYFGIKTGQTYGKKIVGIRIVNVEPERLDEPIDAGRIILRETIGRFINGLLLGYGYLRILIRADRRGLHDAIGKTRVISYGENSLAIKTWQVVVGSLLLLVALGGVGYYVAEFTSYPMREYAKTLEVHGFRFGRIEGSPREGYTISEISRQSENVDFELTNVSFRAVDVVGDNSRSKSFSAITIGGGKITVRQWPVGVKPSEATNEMSGQGAQANSTEDRALLMAIGIPIGLTIQTAELQNIVLELPGRAPMQVKRLSLNEFELKAMQKRVNVGQIYLESDLLLLNLESVTLEPKRVIFGKQAFLQIRPELFPDLLKNPIDLQFDGMLEEFKPTEFKVSAFGKRVTADFNQGKANVTFTGFTPFHFFKTELPLWNIDLRLSGDMKGLDYSQAQGSFGLRTARFQMENGAIAHRRGEKTFEIAPRLIADWKQMLFGKDPGLFLGSSTKQTARESLAELYFTKPSAQLQGGELELLERDLRYLADTADAGTYVPPVPPPAPAQEIRKPAAKKPTSALPTKLPPYIKKATRK